METSIIIVNYNTPQLTSDCIESIKKHSVNSNYEIIIVDNASNDQSVDFLQNRFPDIKIIVSDSNVGFGRANNLGSKSAKGEFVFFLNSDTVFLNDVVANFVSKYRTLEAEGKTLGVLGSLMLNDQLQINSSYGYFEDPYQEIVSILKHSLRIVDLQKRFNSKIGDFHVDWIVGADMFMKKANFEDIGGFDPKFFMYSEEMDLQKRLVEENKLNYIVSGPKLIHLEGGSCVKKLSNGKRLMVDKSRFIYQKKHSNGFDYLIYRVTYFILRSPSIVNRNYSFNENLAYVKQLLKFNI